MSDSSKNACDDYLDFFKAQAKAEKEYVNEEKRKALEQRKFFDAQSLAREASKANVSRHEITHPRDGIYRISLSTAATADDLNSFYKKVDERYLDIASLVLEVTLADGTKVKVPVTPKTQKKVDDNTYHVIAIECPGKGTLEILVRESDNYIVGFRVYHSPDEKDSTKWCTFGEEIPSSFGQAQRTRYASHHVKIEKVEFGAGVLERIFDFFSSLQQNPRMMTSSQGQMFVSALFVLFGECQRFRIHREWSVGLINSENVDHPTLAMAEMMLDWSGLSKAGFSLYLALMEIPLYNAYEKAYMAESVDDYDETLNPYRSLPDAYKGVWNKEKEHAGSGMKFRSKETNKFDIGCLVGGELLLLNHCDKLCDKIHMRKANYRARWY